ncbi:MAG: recombination regulator RecX [Ignavibacteria bacterium]|nr:recombination regulator RecX [Ignavibacteria bacterium]
MAVIERITVLGETTCKVFFTDQEAQLILPKDVVYAFGLRKGDSLDESLIESLQIEALSLKIEHTALRYLSIRLHSAYELQSKLLKKGFTKSQISPIIAKLTKSNLINDLRFAEIYLGERNGRGDGLGKIRNNLLKKGISKDIVQNVCSSIDMGEDYLAKAREICNKKFRILTKTSKSKEKLQLSLTRFMLARGYSYDIVKKCFKDLDFSADEVPED